MLDVSYSYFVGLLSSCVVMMARSKYRLPQFQLFETTLFFYTEQCKSLAFNQIKPNNKNAFKMFFMLTVVYSFADICMPCI